MEVGWPELVATVAQVRDSLPWTIAPRSEYWQQTKARPEL
jgi:hypothetical protein